MKPIRNLIPRGELCSAALLLLVWALLLASCGGRPEVQSGAGKKRVPAVVLEPARNDAIARLLELTGETVAVETVVISATVEGPIGYCPWREGDRVESSAEKPARLVEINRELYRAEVGAAEAALEVARAKLADMRAGTRPEEIAKAKEAVRQLEESATFARNDLERIAKLVESGSLPGEAIEKAGVELVGEQAKLATTRRHLEMLEAGFTRTQIAVQEASIQESQAKLELAKARLAECVIFAPFSGTITRVYVRRGDMASVKAPLLEMADLSSLVIRIAVPEAYAAMVHETMPAHVSLDALPGRRFDAKVARIYPALDRRMRTRTVELELVEPAALLPGMFARVQLVLESVKDALTVPVQAIVRTPAGALVAFVISEGKAEQRKLQTGIEQAGRIQVLAGLEPGEQVVVSGHEKLKHGAEVRISGSPQIGQPSGKGGTR